MQHHNSKLASEMNIVWIDQIASCGGILSRWCTRRPGTARRRPPPSTAREEPLQNRQSRSHFVVESNAVRVIERRIALISDHLGDDVLRDVDPPERPAGLLLPQRQELVSLCDIVLAGGLRTPCRRSPGSWSPCSGPSAMHIGCLWSIGLLARPPPRCACNLQIGRAHV